MQGPGVGEGDGDRRQNQARGLRLREFGEVDAVGTQQPEDHTKAFDHHPAGSMEPEGSYEGVRKAASWSLRTGCPRSTKGRKAEDSDLVVYGSPEWWCCLAPILAVLRYFPVSASPTVRTSAELVALWGNFSARHQSLFSDMKQMVSAA